MSKKSVEITASAKTMKKAIKHVTQGAEIAPPGANISFSYHRAKWGLANSLITPAIFDQGKADLKKLKPGFGLVGMVENYGSPIIHIQYHLPQKIEIQVLREGEVGSMEVPVLETAEFDLIPGGVLSAGKKDAVQCGLRLLLQALGGEMDEKPRKITQEQMEKVLNAALCVTAIQFKNIPEESVSSVTLSRDIEDAYEALEESLPNIRGAKINSVTGIFNTPYGVRTIKYASSGKITIKGSKKDSIRLELVRWVLAIPEGIPSLPEKKDEQPKEEAA
jgi:hypothetical protein